MQTSQKNSGMRQALLDFERRYWRHAVVVLLGFAFLFTGVFTWFMYLIASGGISELGYIPQLMYTLGGVIITLFAVSIYGIIKNSKKA